jgi:hypothetical protein
MAKFRAVMVLMSHLMPGNIVQGVYPITGLNRSR